MGLGNLWAFPYKVSQNGGAAFVFVYILGVIIPDVIVDFAFKSFFSSVSFCEFDFSDFVVSALVFIGSVYYQVAIFNAIFIGKLLII